MDAVQGCIRWGWRRSCVVERQGKRGTLRSRNRGRQESGGRSKEEYGGSTVPTV